MGDCKKCGNLKLAKLVRKHGLQKTLLMRDQESGKQGGCIMADGVNNNSTAPKCNSESRSKGKDKLKLWVANDNKAAFSFYHKIGFYQLMFRSSKMAQHYMGYRDWVFMVKDIA